MKEKGVSLIELILVIVVFGVAALGLVVAMQAAVLDLHKPEVITVAASLAEKELERVIALSFANVNDENRNSPQSYSGDYSAYSWQVRVDSIDDAAPALGSDSAMVNYKVVEARVSHLAIGDISLRVLKTNH